MSRLILSRPLAFIDLETTGINVSSDRIVEISILKREVDNSEASYTRRVNPLVPIPPTSTEIHGISDEDVSNEPSFKEIASEVNEFIAGCDLAGYNSNHFDIPLLAEEFLRVDMDFSMKNRKLVDVQTIFFKKEPRTLAAAYQFYCGKELDGAHGAEADVKATAEVFLAQLDRYEDLGDKVAELSEFTTRQRTVDLIGRIVYNDKDEPCFNFGKYKGKTVSNVLSSDPSYYGWMMNGNFPLYTKKVLTALRLEMKTQE